MRSIVLKAPGKVTNEMLPRQECRPGMAVIDVKSVGICGSDVGAYRGKNPLVTYPVVIGHEIAGVVSRIRGGNGSISVGDRVVIDPYLACGNCYPCNLGRTNCCESLRVLGVHVDGGLSDQLQHPANMMHKIPDSMNWTQAAMVEPLTIALHAIHRTGLSKGEYIVIAGAGTIGLLIALAAQEYGAKPILLDIVEERLVFARILGVKHVINIEKESPIERISEITAQRMAEVVVEASGANTAIAETLSYASYAGRIALTGWPKEDTLLKTSLITRKELNIYGSRTSVGEFPEAIALIERKRIEVERLITKTITMAETGSTLQSMAERPQDFLKVVVLPNKLDEE